MDELIQQRVSRFLTSQETESFTHVLKDVAHDGAKKNVRLNPRDAGGEVIPTILNVSALKNDEAQVVGAIGTLRDMRPHDDLVRSLEQSKAALQEKIEDLEKFEEVVVGRELKMIELEKENERLKEQVRGCSCGAARPSV